MTKTRKSILPILLLASVACHLTVAKEESKDKQDVGTVIGIDLGKCDLFDVISFTCLI